MGLEEQEAVPSVPRACSFCRPGSTESSCQVLQHTHAENKLKLVLLNRATGSTKAGICTRRDAHCSKAEAPRLSVVSWRRAGGSSALPTRRRCLSQLPWLLLAVSTLRATSRRWARSGRGPRGRGPAPPRSEAPP